MLKAPDFSRVVVYREYVKKYIEKLREKEEYSATRREENQLENELLRFFIEDLTYWLTTNNRKLAIFLDSYEVLQDRGRKSKEHPEPDWWLKGEENLLTGDKWSGLLMSIPNVVWVISGRKDLKFTGELGNKLHKQELEPFNDTYSMQFLRDRGITNNVDLCLKLTKLTRGYPLYLELCGQQYRMLKNKHRNYEPIIEDFGPENESFNDRVGKLVVNLIECMDDTGIREMIKYLCVIKDWTDEIADEIIPVYNDTAYNLIKDFSFIRTVDASDEGLEKIFRFDSNVQEILVRKYKKENKPIVKRALNGINKYFIRRIDELIEQDKELDSNREEFDQYLEEWVKTVIRLTDDPSDLMDQFEENISTYVDRAYSHMEEEVLTLFFEKVKTISEEESLPYAYFELHMAFVKNHSWHQGEALDYAKSAREKFRKLRVKEDTTQIDRLTLDALRIISDSTKEIGHYEEDIELKKEIVEFFKIVCKDYPERIYDAMWAYADALEKIGNSYEAFGVRKEIIQFAEHNFPEREGLYVKRVKAMREVAYSEFTHHDEGLKLLKKCADILKKEKHPDDIGMMNEVADALNYIGRVDEEIALRKEIWDYSRDKLGDESDVTFRAGRDFSIALRYNNKEKKADEILEKSFENRAKALELHVKKLAENDPDSINLLDTWADTLHSMERYEDELSLRREILKRCQNIYGKYDDNIIQNMRELLRTLRYTGNDAEADKLKEQISILLREAVDYFKNSNEKGHISKYLKAMQNLAKELHADDERIELYREIVRLSHDNIGGEDISIFDYVQSIQELANILEDEQEVMELHKEAVMLMKENYGNHQQTMNAMEDLIRDYKEQNMMDEAISLQKELVDIRLNEWGDAACETIWTIQEWADMFHDIGKYEEEIKNKRWALECARKRGETRKQTIYAMRYLAEALSNPDVYKEEYKDEMLGLYEKALEISRERFGDSNAYTIETIKLYADALRLSGEKDAVEKIYSLFSEHKSKREMRTLIRLYKSWADELEYEERFEELLDVQKKLLELYEQQSDKENVISTTFQIADTLEKLERSEEGKKLLDELEQKLKESISQYKDDDEFNEAYVEKLKKLESFLENSERYEEALEIQRKISEVYKELGDTEQLIDSLKNVEYLLDMLENEADIESNRKQIIDGYKQLLNERLEEFAEDDDEVLEVMDNWAAFLEYVDRYDEALEIRQKILELSTKSYEEEELDYDDYITLLENVADDLKELKRYDEEVEKRKQIVSIYQENDELEDYTINELVEALENANRPDEAKEWINKLKDTDND